MSWTKTFERLMRDAGHEPYGCLVEHCNHVAKSTLGLLLHQRHGLHHLEHENMHLQKGPNS
jgi:hypothetical protein